MKYSSTGHGAGEASARGGGHARPLGGSPGKHQGGGFRGKPWDFVGIYRETSMGFFDVLNKNAANYAQNHDFSGFPWFPT